MAGSDSAAPALRRTAAWLKLFSDDCKTCHT
jgi:predicted CxxxxCH...CXXCH cytochrome family protein